MKPRVTIIEACNDKALFAGWFKDRKTWAAWFVVLKALFSLPMSDADLVLFKQYTGRTASPSNGFREAWLCIGRRGGKSRILALIAVFLATFVNWASYLSPGEIGVIVIIATDRRQARVIFKYIRALLKVPMLAKMVEHATDEAIDLKNGLRIEIQTASFRSVRGHTVIAALCDEIAFWRTDETSANPDREILDALRPAMATIPRAMLLCASSPYARRGTLYDAIRKHHGNDGSSVLAWKADTRAMNETVPPKQPFVLALSENPNGSGRLEPLAGFMTNPAGAAIVNTVGPIRQVTQGDGVAQKRYLVIATGTPAQPGELVQIQTQP